MKNSVAKLFAMAFAVFLMACENRKNDDSTEIAEEQNDKNKDSNDEKDADFAVKVTDGGLYEVQLSTMALTKSTSAEVKKFAQMMVDDHTKANNELKALASDKGIALPDIIGEKKQKKYYDLERDEKKENFDKNYMDEMVSEHKDMINAFEKEAENGKDADVKSWAAGKLSALRHHLEEAERVRDLVKDPKR